MATENGTGNTGGKNGGRTANRTRSGSTGSGGYGTDRQGSGNRAANGRDTGSYGAGNRPGTGNRGTGGRNTGKKKNGRSNSDRMMNIFLVLLALTIIVLAILYFKKDPDEPANVPPTGQVQPGGTQIPGNLTPGGTPSIEPLDPVTPEPSATDMPAEPVVTDEPVKEPTPQPTALPEPSDTPEPTKEVEPTRQPESDITQAPVAGGIDAEEANDILAGIFWEAGYRFTLSDSHFSQDGEEYYRYDVSFDRKAQDYDVLVHRENGDVYYYENGTIREFDGLPEHAQQGGIQDEGMTADAAAELLEQIPYASLGLPAALDECSLALDNWKTVVDGEESYCLNVFYQGALAGNIYFTEDAKHVYYLDEFGEFVKVR